MLELDIKQPGDVDDKRTIEFCEGDRVFLALRITGFFRYKADLIFDGQHYSLTNTGFWTRYLEIRDVVATKKVSMKIKYPTWGRKMKFRVDDMLEFWLAEREGFVKTAWVIKEQPSTTIADLTLHNWSFSPKRKAILHVQRDHPWLKFILGVSWVSIYTIRSRRAST